MISQLEAMIAQRRNADPDSSYVAKLRHKGRKKMAQKLGEEAVEAVIAAIADDQEEMVSESADMLFHLLVLLADMGVKWDDVMAELAKRQGLSGLEEKASRSE